MKEYKIDMYGGYAWKFVNLPTKVDGVALRSEQIKKKQTDYNIGFDKGNSKEFLKHIEVLTRKEQSSSLNFILTECPIDTPHHLDNRKEYIKYEKKSFSNLIIERTELAKRLKKKTIH